MVLRRVSERVDELRAQLEEQQQELSETRQMIADLRREMAEWKANLNVTPQILPKLETMQDTNANRAKGTTTTIDNDKVIWKLKNLQLENEGLEDRLNQSRIALRETNERLNDTNFKLMEAIIKIRSIEQAAERREANPPNPDPDTDMGPLGVRVYPCSPCPSGSTAGALAIPYELADEDEGEPDWIDQLYRMEAEPVG